MKNKGQNSDTCIQIFVQDQYLSLKLFIKNELHKVIWKKKNNRKSKMASFSFSNTDVRTENKKNCIMLNSLHSNVQLKVILKKKIIIAYLIKIFKSINKCIF